MHFINLFSALSGEKILYFTSPQDTCDKVTAFWKIRNTLPSSRKSRSNANGHCLERTLEEGQGCDTLAARGGESFLRLSFELFVYETRATRHFARRREAVTGKQRVRGAWSTDTIDEIGWAYERSGRMKGCYEGQ